MEPPAKSLLKRAFGDSDEPTPAKKTGHDSCGVPSEAADVFAPKTDGTAVSDRKQHLSGFPTTNVTGLLQSSP